MDPLKSKVMAACVLIRQPHHAAPSPMMMRAAINAVRNIPEDGIVAPAATAAMVMHSFHNDGVGKLTVNLVELRRIQSSFLQLTDAEFAEQYSDLAENWENAQPLRHAEALSLAGGILRPDQLAAYLSSFVQEVTDEGGNPADDAACRIVAHSIAHAYNTKAFDEDVQSFTEALQVCRNKAKSAK